MNSPYSFVECWIMGEVEAHQIHEFIEDWHAGVPDLETSVELYEFLGLTKEDYASWVEDNSKLELILSGYIPF